MFTRIVRLSRANLSMMVLMSRLVSGHQACQPRSTCIYKELMSLEGEMHRAGTLERGERRDAITPKFHTRSSLPHENMETINERSVMWRRRQAKACQA